jgi:hypothetical protein
MTSLCTPMPPNPRLPDPPYCVAAPTDFDPLPSFEETHSETQKGNRLAPVEGHVSSKRPKIVVDLTGDSSDEVSALVFNKHRWRFERLT